MCLGDELVRVVQVVGKPKDLARMIDQIREKARSKNPPAGRSDPMPAAEIAGPVLARRVTAAQGAWSVIGAVLTLMLVAGALANYVPGLIGR